MKNIAISSLLFLFCLFFSSVESEAQKVPQINLTPQEIGWVQDHPVIRVQNEDDYPPYDFSEDGEPLGFSIEYLKLIAQKTGLNFTFINGYSWLQILDNIQSKELDIIHTCLKTKERQVYASFTAPYIKTTYALIVPASTDISSIEDMSGKKLAVLKGTKHIDFIKQLQLNIEFVEYDTTKEILRSVLFKECDAAYETLQLAGYTAKDEGIVGLDFKPVAMLEANAGDWRIGVRNDWPELLSIINKGMNAVTREEMSRLKAKWFGLSSYRRITIDLTKKEQDYLARHPVINVSNEQDYPPYDFTIGNQPNGYSIDLLNMLAQRIGVSIQYINGYTWNQLMTMFREGDIDLLHTLNKTPERQKNGIFSEPYQSYKNRWIVARNGSEFDDINQLYGKTVTVGKGWSQEEFLTNEHPKIRLLIVDGFDSMFDAISTGKADAMIGEVPAIQYIFKKRGITDLKLSGWAKEFDRGKKRKFHFMAHNSAPELISMLNKALSSLTPIDIEKLDRKWFGNNTKSSESGNDKRVTLTLDEKNYLAGKDEIIVSASPHRMPYQGFDKNDLLEGMAADYLAIFEKRIGIPFRVLPAVTAVETVASVEKRKADLLLLTDVSAKPEGKLEVSTPYISFPYVIATTTDKLFIEDIRKKMDKTYAVIGGTAIVERLRQHYPTMHLLEVNSPLEGLQKVRKEEVFGFIDTSAAISYIIQKELILDVKITGTMTLYLELGGATKVSEPLLGSIFQKAIDSVSSDEKQRIYNRWIAVNYEQGIDYSLIWKILFVSFIILAVTLFWNRKLATAKKQTLVVKDQLQEKNAELEQLAITDVLTGLNNRVKLDQTLLNEVIRFKRYHSPLALIILDIDFFKMVNDQFGHQTGDSVLQNVAATLLNNVRNVDTVGRWGGEEFLVICPETDLAKVLGIAEKLRVEMAQLRLENGVKVTASFGVAQLCDGEDSTDIIRKADTALYKAKKNGRNRVESM